MVHHLPENHAIPAKLVHQPCLSHYWSQSRTILLGDIPRYIDTYGLELFLLKQEQRSWLLQAPPYLALTITSLLSPSLSGVAPPSFFFIRAGTTLYQLTTATGHVSMQSVAILAGLALLSLLPVLFKRMLRKKLE